MIGGFEAAFAALTADGSQPPNNSYLVLSLGGSLESWFVGIDDQGCPCVLVESSSKTERQLAPIKLENLDVHFHIPCKVKIASQAASQSTCSVLRLKSQDSNTRAVFFSVCDSIAKMLGSAPRNTDLSKAMRRLAAIFRRMLAPPSRSLAGLFGELVLIYRSLLPHELVKDWRETDKDRYDFSANDLKVEVKSTSTRRRIHEFSHEQCCTPAGSLGLVASVFVERTSRGTSVRGLQEMIESRVSSRPETIFKLREVIANSLGDAQVQADEIGFDLTLAIESVSFYDLQVVTAIRGKLPSLVSNVRFASDLSETEILNVEELSNSHASLTAYIHNKFAEG